MEYWQAGTWLVVARFEHDAEGKPYQDWRTGGPHLDVHDPAGQEYKLTEFADIDPRRGLRLAKRFFTLQPRMVGTEVRAPLINEELGRELTKTDRMLMENVDGYEPPTEEELNEWVEEAGPPFPEENEIGADGSGDDLTDE